MKCEQPKQPPGKVNARDIEIGSCFATDDGNWYMRCDEGKAVNLRLGLLVPLDLPRFACVTPIRLKVVVDEG